VKMVTCFSGTGDSALTYACENGHTDVADLLLQYSAQLEHESEGGRTPLMKVTSFSTSWIRFSDPYSFFKDPDPELAFKMYPDPDIGPHFYKTLLEKKKLPLDHFLF